MNVQLLRALIMVILCTIRNVSITYASLSDHIVTPNKLKIMTATPRIVGPPKVSTPQTTAPTTNTPRIVVPPKIESTTTKLPTVTTPRIVVPPKIESTTTKLPTVTTPRIVVPPKIESTTTKLPTVTTPRIVVPPKIESTTTKLPTVTTPRIVVPPKIESTTTKLPTVTTPRIVVPLKIESTRTKLSAETTPNIIVPPKISSTITTTKNTVPPRPSPFTMPGHLISIVKRATNPQPKVPPTINSKHIAQQQSDVSQDGSNNFLLHLKVPPTISTGLQDGTGNKATTLKTPPFTKPRVLCYSDQPIEPDVPCTGDSKTMGMQHMEALYNDMGGSDIQSLLTIQPPNVTLSADMGGSDDHNLAEPGVQDKFDKLIFEISLQLNQRMISSLERQPNTDLQATANEIIALTDALFECMCSVYTEDFVLSLFSTLNSSATDPRMAQDSQLKGWQSVLAKVNSSSVDFATDIAVFSKAVQQVRHFYQDLLNNSKNYDERKDLIENFQKDIDFDQSQNMYENINSAISTFKHLYSLMTLGSLNATNITRLFSNSTVSGDSKMDGEEQCPVLLTDYMKSVSLYKSIRFHPNHSDFPKTSTLTDEMDPRTVIEDVTSVLRYRLNDLEQLLQDSNVEVGECQSNLEKLGNLHTSHRRTRRDIIGVSNKSCKNQGEIIDTEGILKNFGLLSLCSSCVQDTSLSEDFFPRHIPQRLCQPGQTMSFTGQQIPHEGCMYQPQPGGPPIAAGVCVQQFAHINILRRVPGKCMKILLDGAEVITDSWELTPYPIGVGCECAVGQVSRMAKYITQNSA